MGEEMVRNMDREMLRKYNTKVLELQLQDRYSYRRYPRLNCKTFEVKKI